jgi:hypothetical protein
MGVFLTAHELYLIIMIIQKLPVNGGHANKTYDFLVIGSGIRGMYAHISIKDIF